MRQLPMTESWSETTGFVAREAGLLFPVAFALIALPGIIFQYVAPQPRIVEVSESAAASVPPGPWVLMIIPVILLSLLGALALSNLALRSGITVGEAIADGARRLLPTLGAVILLVLAGFLIAVPFGMIAMLLAGGNAAVATGILTPLLFAIFIILGVRMLFLYPVGAAERLGPIAMLRRNWTLTRGHGFKLFAFLCLAVLLILVVSLAVTLVVGVLVTLTIGAPADNDLARLLVLLASGLVNTVVTVYLVTMIARLYAGAAAFAQ